MGKGYFGIALILLIVVGIFAFGFLGSFTAKDSYLFIPVIDHNKMKDLAKPKPITMTKVVQGITVADNTYCEYLQNVTKEESFAFACKDLGTSYYYKDKAFGYAQEEFKYYNRGLITVEKGCSVIEDYCKSDKVLYEANCKAISSDAVKIGGIQYLSWPVYETKDCSDYGASYICNKGACIPGLCGNGELDDGEQCDDGGIKPGDGCDSKCKIEKAPDLVVQKIQMLPLQDKCINSLTFDICNIGNMPVLDDFNISVSINGIERKITYLLGKYGGYDSGCVTLEDPKKLDLAQFGVGIKETYNVVIILDTENAIDEKNEENVFEESGVYSGDSYLDSGSVCKVTCTDLDAYLGGKHISKVQRL